MMILLVTSSNRRIECGITLEKSIGESVEVCETVHGATLLLRNNSYSAVVLDDPMVEADADALESLLNHIGLALPVYVNFAISNAERIARELRLALRRNRESRLIAIRAAGSQLRSEIREELTGVLLSLELAMRTSEMPTEAFEKLTSVCRMVGDLRSRLSSVS